MEVWKHVRAILVLPFTVTVVIPGGLVEWSELDSFGLWHLNPAIRFVLSSIGLLFVGVGLSLMIATIRLFVKVGKGTLAPWNSTQRLVVQGVYRHVRNPMIAGVFAVLLGESLLTASLPLFCWFLLFVVANAVYIPLFEEPGLVKRFGDDYLVYRQNVPRWIPRRTPWIRRDEESVESSASSPV